MYRGCIFFTVAQACGVSMLTVMLPLYMKEMYAPSFSQFSPVINNKLMATKNIIIILLR